ncbi:Hint domain-containing protein [Gluconacetobacter sp. Hr-1-5]|uniref:Hint domain-containing protein n=1 Tax=Gluconacetobacter sp. Hr-1-5 TaxID=3395370 RepID=UPI003B51932B
MVQTASGVTYTETESTIGIPGILTTTQYHVVITDPAGNAIYTGDLSSGINLLQLKIAPTGDVVTGSSSITTLVGLIGGTYVSMPGSTGAINLVANAISGNTYYIGGKTDINIGVNALSGNTVNIYGGTASFSGSSLIGLLSGSTINIGYGGTYNGSSNLITILAGSTVNFQSGGGTLILNADNGVLNLLANNGASAVTFNNYDPTYDTIELQNTTQPIATYNISSSGSSKIITMYGADGQVVANYSVNPANASLLPDATYIVGQGANPLKVTYSAGNTYIGICFLADSMISTPTGPVAVQDLESGNDVTVYVDGEALSRKVIWAGKTHATVNPDRPDDQAGWPVRILKDAISEGVPCKDLLITAEHCLFFDGKFVPARMLINGRSIFYDKSFTAYEYYHIETEDHSVIMADGVLTESYLDTGNRRTFRKQGHVTRIGGHAKTWSTDAAAPLGVDRAFVEPLFRRLETRARQAGLENRMDAPVLTNDADLHLLTDRGQIVRPARPAGEYVTFMLPTGVESVRLLSRTSRPSDVIGPFVDDRRNLGVSVGEIILFEGNHAAHITAHLTEQDLPGWATPHHENSRWTEGEALLPIGTRYPNSIALLAIQIKVAGPYTVSARSAEPASAQIA